VFAHLHAHSEFSFLDGASKAKDLVAAAAAHGMGALALTEHNNVASAVRFLKLCRTAGLRAIVGAEIDLGLGNAEWRMENEECKVQNAKCKVQSERPPSPPHPVTP